MVLTLAAVQFYERLPRLKPPPTTAAPGCQSFREAYDRLAAEGAAEILSIHISHTLSAIVDVAKQAAERNNCR